MALRPNAIMIFTDYAVVDTGITFHFVCPDPGPGLNSDYFVFLTDAELAGVSSQPQLRTLVQTKLDRKLRALGIATKLDAFIGQSLTVV